jgi:hypothetical protein
MTAVDVPAWHRDQHSELVAFWSNTNNVKSAEHSRDVCKLLKDQRRDKASMT